MVLCAFLHKKIHNALKIMEYIMEDMKNFCINFISDGKTLLILTHFFVIKSNFLVPFAQSGTKVLKIAIFKMAANMQFRSDPECLLSMKNKENPYF